MITCPICRSYCKISSDQDQIQVNKDLKNILGKRVNDENKIKQLEEQIEQLKKRQKKKVVKDEKKEQVKKAKDPLRMMKDFIDL